ncbi:UPF0149 family protein [Azoarcus sp. DN11]|uniref:UPF0149 family protein n=1 Tax=Azoarcus sp. DN11 TaxID=356837 RepID=UPI000EB3FBA5|nr:UPF0149 family protein [Azoarcus sp. DN11]AYH44852.1 YecA family protein [Azoarcus sp. DN11]
MTSETAADAGSDNPHLLDDHEFEALEELLTSDVVPEDCMNLEMLDGYLAAVIASPVTIDPEQWLPPVWSAHGDEISFGSGSQLQRAIRLVRRYYNELATTLGQPEGWEPFCYAASEGDTIAIGEEWIEGFAQGLELWPADWDADLPEDAADAVRTALDELMAPWTADDAEMADEDTRLQWLEQAVSCLEVILGQWRALGLGESELLSVDGPAVHTPAAVGRNDPCPCGSGKKYKKCCGAAVE